MTTKKAIQQQITALERRLQPLKLRQAREGYHTDPAVINEIEDIENSIARLRQQLPTAPDGPPPDAAPPPPGGGVSIGSVGGDIRDSTIAGGNVQQTTEISGSGNVIIQGGTFTAGERSVIGSTAGGDITTGDTHTGLDGESLAALFAALREQIDADPSLTSADREDVAAEMAELEADATAKAEAGTEPDDSFLRRRLRAIEQMAPDIIDTIATTAVNPVAGVKGVWDKIVAKAREIKAARSA